DSYKIAKLLRRGNFPIAYEFPENMRATRDLLRRRNRLVRYSGELKAHVKNTASQYNLPDLNKYDLRYENNRAPIRHFFPDAMVQISINLDLDLVTYLDKELAKVEWKLKKHAQDLNGKEFSVLKTVPGIGDILALTILYEIGDISRFESVQKFASCCRLVKCKAESAGKVYGTQGNKIGNAHLKWAFSEAAVLFLLGNDDARRYLQSLQRRMPKSKALTVLAHKLGRAVYFMLKIGSVFDEARF
ncbi:transposase, partial [Endozoicomonas sp. ONNA1]|uniref:transposase n=1 Tax=Endozoicomonas sp. ONNA1 TaxID=2828740 RepID=UPI0021472B36